MKKWHMESIVSLSGGNRKLALPESNQIQLGPTIRLREGGKEFVLISTFRYIYALIRKLF